MIPETMIQEHPSISLCGQNMKTTCVFCMEWDSQNLNAMEILIESSVKPWLYGPKSDEKAASTNSGVICKLFSENKHL